MLLHYRHRFTSDQTEMGCQHHLLVEVYQEDLALLEFLQLTHWISAVSGSV